ncbi:hypothetical protein like AT4G29090 [Hibiscus trionum]|uniref:Reverse transcriptase zinc-binding domain-containing protein n=1 Tax=Hibiscus trionum TaxID=183268 RepID=A0A9W7MT31_HIBTR|nr:hypothetical protein like AT4G29090 [Hibiscus trionum]
MQTMILPKKVCNDIEGLIRRFIWGSASPTPKLSLINWEAICQPMKSGGLGLRCMHNFNIAFILKLSYSIVTRTSSLWVTLLREKYGLQEILPQSVRKGSCTSLWRAIANSWDLLRDNLAWSLGNGESVNFLQDVWIPVLGPLRNHLLYHVSLGSTFSFAEFITNDGNWDLAKLSMFFTQTVVQHIAGIKCPTFQDVSDSCFWKHDSKHVFSIQSAYACISNQQWDAHQPIWKQIWHLLVP